MFNILSLLFSLRLVVYLFTYSSRYVSNVSFALISNFLSLSLGTAPSSIGGLYLLLHGDLKRMKMSLSECYYQ